MQFKYGTIYREVIRTKKLDWCESSRKKTLTDPEIRQIFKFLKFGDPQTVHECPYSKFMMQNFTFKANSMESVFPTGDYKLRYNFFDMNNVFIFNVTFIAQLKTSNRDTFG